MATKNLPALVRDRFSQAQKTGDLTYYPTQLALLQCNGLPFQIRFSPALAKKPKSDKSANTNKPFDPFEDPPQALRITQLRPSHYLVLNMFPVIPDHFLLLTTAFKEQTHLLEEDDLEAAYACIGAYKEEGEELFGFYNSGEHSGASQPHRHIQFLPVESMRIGLGEGENWSPLVDRLAEENAAEMPFRYFSATVPPMPTAAFLHETYLTLHKEACQVARELGVPLVEDEHQSPISYNLAITDKAMVLCPRTREGIEIQTDSGILAGPVALNGTLLAGTALVKNEAEWNALRNDSLKLREVLMSIGLPSAGTGSASEIV